LTGIPKSLLEYVGSEKQLFSGLAIGPDGLYVAPLLPDSEGVGSVLKISYNPDDPHPRTLHEELNVSALFEQYACLSCHVIDRKGNGLVGPILDRKALGKTLMERLHTPEYEAILNTIDGLKVEPYLSTAAGRDAVRKSQGKERVRNWLINRLLEPRFDRKVTQMPNVGMNEEEAKVIADWFMDFPTENPTFLQKLATRILPTPSYKSLMLMFILGGLASVIATVILAKLKQRAADPDRRPPSNQP
jgi:hypothetical protein